jgi:DNA-directed RNA polymerase subunit L/DNA-directed RNA polymerase alpha subunit
MSKESVQFKKSNYDINIEEVSNHKSNGLDASVLSLKMYGSDLNMSIYNTLRRANMNDIPTYAIPIEQITIDENTTAAYNNDYMKLRLSMLRVPKIDPKLSFLAEKYWNKDSVNYADPKREKHPNESNIEFYINCHNNTAENTQVTTNDIKVYVEGEQQQLYNKKYPTLLIELRPNDRFKCHMKACLGVADRNVIWAASTNSYYDDEIYSEENSLLYSIEGNDQIQEYDIMIRTCEFLMRKYTDLKADLKKRVSLGTISSENKLVLVLENETHTIGGPLNYELQNHKNIMSGCIRPSHLVKSISLKIESIPGTKSTMNTIIDCIDIIIDKFEHIGYLLTKLKDKTKK